MKFKRFVLPSCTFFKNESKDKIQRTAILSVVFYNYSKQLNVLNMLR